MRAVSPAAIASKSGIISRAHSTTVAMCFYMGRTGDRPKRSEMSDMPGSPYAPKSPLKKK